MLIKALKYPHQFPVDKIVTPVRGSRQELIKCLLFFCILARRDNTLYVRCATLSHLAHAATILCMCHVPLFALRHTLRQEKAEKCRKGCNSCNSCISCSSCSSCNSCSSRIVCRRCRFPARSFANKKLTLSCRVFSDMALEGQFFQRIY